jgi:hypothetical protein
MKYELKGVYNEKSEEKCENTIPIFIRVRERMGSSHDFAIDNVDKSGNKIASSNLLVFKQNKNGKYIITVAKGVNPDLPFELDICGHVITTYE